MTRIETFRENIKNALLNRQGEVSVPYYNAQELFNSVLSECADLAESVAQFDFKPLLVGGVFNIRYQKRVDAQSQCVLVDTEDELEDMLHRSIRGYQSKTTVSASMELNIKEIFDSFMTAYKCYYSNLTKIECRWKLDVKNMRYCVNFIFSYRIGRVKLTMMEAKVNEKIEELGHTLFCREMSDEVKAFVAHNYLAKTVKYWLDEEAKPLERSYMQSAYGALINLKCVCQGYAEAYKRILNSQGIICEVISGKIKGRDDRHAWNVVSFNGKDYYHIDVTWDAQKIGEARYKYYGLSDADLSPKRLWTRTSNIVCDGKEDILRTAKLQIAMRAGEFASKGAHKEYFK